MKTLLTILTFTFITSSFGQQTGELRIKILSKIDRQTIPFCSVQLYQDGKQTNTAQSDFDGVAKLKFSNSSPVILSIDNIGYREFDTIINPTNFKNDLNIQLDTINEDIDYNKIYNQQTAYKDLKDGNYKILFVGLIFVDDQNKINKCCNKYGFTYTFTTDVISGNIYEAVENYNYIIMQYLDMKNKPGWREELKKNCNITLK